MFTPKEMIVTGLDIGSSKVSCVSLLCDGRSMNVAAHATVPSRGVSAGIFTSLDDVTESAAKALAKVRQKLGKRPENIFVNISGAGIKAQRSSGMIPLASRGREVAPGDIQRVIEASGIVTVPMDREIIHRIVHRFSVDGENFIKDPTGLHSARLSCDAYLVTAPVNQIHDIQKCVNDAGYELKEVVFTGIADSLSVFDKEDREGWTALVDVGHSITELSIFSDGYLERMDVLPFGTVNLGGGFREDPVADEVFAGISSQIRQSGESGTKINSVIVTGGAAYIDGFMDFIESRLSRPAKIGSLKDVTGNITSSESVRALTAIGLARYGAEKLYARKRELQSPIRNISSKVVDLLNNYF